VLFGVLVCAGTATTTDRFPLGLLWPAAGVGVPWLMMQRTSRGWWGCLLTIGALKATVLTVAGLPAPVVLGLGAGSLLQVVAVAQLLRTWCPDILGSGGDGSIHDLGVLIRSVLAGLVGSSVAVVPVLICLIDESAQVSDVVAWWGGAFTGLVMITTVGHLAWEYLRLGQRPRMSGTGWGELAALWGLTAAVLARLGLSEHGSSFLVFAPAIWAALRFRTVYAAAHVSLISLVCVWITATGRGPFAAIEDAHVSALTFQSFLLLMLIATLAVATARDQRNQAMSGVYAAAEVSTAMSESMTEGIVVLGRDGKIQRLNAAADPLVGTLDEDDAPRSVRARAVTGEPLSVEQHPFHLAMATGEVVQQEVILTLRDGRERLVVVTASPLRSHEARPDAPAAVVVYRDVTDERRRAEVLAAMYETMTEGLIVVDDDGRFLEQNGSSRRLLAQTSAAGADNIYDYRLLRLDGTPLPPEEHPSTRARAERRPVTQDVVLPLANGERRTLAITAAPLTGGFAFDVAPAVLKVYRDVTDERRRAGQLADFAGVVAHDLRSPLSATKGWLDLADELQDDHAAIVHALGRARGGVDRMGVLIADLLSQATADGGTLHLEPVDLGGPDGLVAELESIVDPHEEADIVADDLPQVLGDPEMITQLLNNLLSNSLKYVEPGTTPRIQLTGRTHGTRVEVELSDNGIGIPEDQRELVFERFHRAHPQDARYSGTGLGLAICRAIVERHGGRIAAHPGPDGVGTTFSFDLPAVAGRR
jgi:PAS domain S-box-containing protein